jgi:hypothetical protein
MFLERKLTRKVYNRWLLAELDVVCSQSSGLPHQLVLKFPPGEKPELFGFTGHGPIGESPDLLFLSSITSDGSDVAELSQLVMQENRLFALPQYYFQPIEKGDNPMCAEFVGSLRIHSGQLSFSFRLERRG